MELFQEEKNLITCAWCGRDSYIEWIHGRGQCSSCKVILNEDFGLCSLIQDNKFSGIQNKLNKTPRWIFEIFFKNVLKYLSIP